MKELHSTLTNSADPDEMLYIRGFPKSDFGPNISPFSIQKSAKTFQNVVYHSQFLSSTFW